jgi:hypothetical protein
MPKISLWSKNKTNDYRFIDNIAGDLTDHGGTGAFIHKYVGPVLDDNDSRISNELTIQDILFLENRERKYDCDIYELRGHYDPADKDFDLTQFGLMFSDDTLTLVFHISNMVSRLGRRINSGDVIELPHLRDIYSLDEDREATNRFYVVEESANLGSGYGPRWDSHFWRVRMKLMTDSTEFRDILGDGSEDGDIRNSVSAYCDILGISDDIVDEAESNVPYDTKFFETDHLWVSTDSKGVPYVYFRSGDGNPPNGEPLAGMGASFPEDLNDGDYFLRTDYDPSRLFKKQGDCFIKIEDDTRKKWTGAAQILDSFIENDNKTCNDDGTVMDERQALSKVVRPKEDE